MIRLENIRYHSILSNIDLHLEKGKIVMLLGENGCGKTTLIKCLLQLIPYDGKVYFQDRLINDLDKRSLAEIFSYVPQIKTLVDHISVLEFVVAGRTCAENHVVGYGGVSGCLWPYLVNQTPYIV